MILLCCFWVVTSEQGLLANVSSERGANARGFSARDGALAGPHTADLESTLGNPGIYGLLRSSSLWTTNSIGILDRSAQSISTSLVLGPWGSVGLSGSLDSFGSFEKRNIYGAPIGSFKANKQAIGFGYGWGRNGWGLGFKLEWIRDKVDSIISDQTLMGFGIAAQKVGFNFGLSSFVQNQAGKGFGELSFGMGKSFHKGNFVFDPLVSTDFRQKASTLARIGVQVSYANTISLRVGFETLAFQGLGILRGLRTGLGINRYGLALDYALESQGSLGMEHRISLGYRFGSLVRIPDPLEQARVLYEKAVEFKAQGLGDAAIDALGKAVRKDPSYWKAWHLLGTSLYEAGDIPGTKEAFLKYLELNPSDESLRQWLDELGP